MELRWGVWEGVLLEWERGSPFPCLFWEGIDAPLQNALKAAGVTCCVRAVEPRYSFTYTGHLNVADKKAAFVVCQQVETPAWG